MFALPELSVFRVFKAASSASNLDSRAVNIHLRYISIIQSNKQINGVKTYWFYLLSGSPQHSF